MKEQEEHWFIHYGNELKKHTEESEEGQDQTLLELRALKTVQEFKQTINASMLSEHPEIGTLIMLAKEYRETLGRARELCYPVTKRRFIRTLRKLNELHDRIGRIAGWISHKTEHGVKF